MTPELFKKIASHWLSGVAIVTSVAEDGELVGMTMSAVSSLSLNPPQFLACMDNRAKTLTKKQMDQGGIAVPRYVSHYVTCPDAKQHRKGK